MKNIFLSLLTAFTLIACYHDDYIPKISDLPPATQTGKNTAGCLINGQAFIRYGLGSSFNCFYQDGLNFGLGFDWKTSKTIKAINIASLNQHLEEGQTYQLKEYAAGSKYGEYVIFGEVSDIEYKTTSLVTGELTITHHDFDHAIISGTFWFDAINDKGEKIEVREGRFDAKY